MEKNTLENMTFKQKGQTLAAIFNEYQNAKFKLENDYFKYTPSHRLLISENSHMSRKSERDTDFINHLAKMNSYREYVAFIDDALRYLPPELRTLIENDYIHPLGAQWWNNYYSRSTYYRHKKKAFDILLPLLMR